MRRLEHTRQKPPDKTRAQQEDELLIIRCRLDDRSAFDELIQRWNVPLWRYVRGLAGEDEAAKDVAQALLSHGARFRDARRRNRDAGRARREVARLTQRRETLERELGRISR